MLIALALGVVYLAWGSTYLAIRIAINDIPPFLMLSARFLIAGVLLLAWARWRRPDAPLPTAQQWRTAAMLGIAFFVAGNGGVAWAEQFIPTGTVALIVAVIPVFMVALDRIFWKAGLTGRVGIGMAIGLAGVAGIVGIPTAEFPVWAAMVPVGGALAWAVGSLHSRRAALPDDVALAVAMQVLVAGVVLLALGLVTGELGRFDPSAVSTSSLAAVLYLAVVGSVITFSLYAWLLRVAPTPLVGTYALVNPVVALGLGSLVLGETMTPVALLAAAVTLAGVALIVASPPRRDARVRRRSVRRVGLALEPVPASNR